MDNSVFRQNIAKDVWFQTYKWETDKTVNDTFRRVAKKLASIEKDPAHWEEVYFDILSNFKYVPGGRIISNAGTDLKGTSFVNCFVSGFKGESQDSIEGIFDELKRQAKILKSEGGYGFCANVLRPNGSYIKGIGSESPGSVAMLDLWDTVSMVITSGSSVRQNKNKGKNKIRKGAMMVTLSIWHPDIEEYITRKQVPGKLSKFNMSVLVHDNFMEAVKNHLPWNLEFPEIDHENYDKEWDGDLDKWKSKGYPVKVYKTFADANELWDMIVKLTYNRNEPGILFIDRANKLSNLQNIKYNATNPCGEQYLEPNGSCVLGAQNLVKYVNSDRSDYDYDALRRDIPNYVRLQDSVNDLTQFPLPEQKEVAQKNRRVGIGYMGYGSSLYLLKLAYGSKEALEKTEKLCSFITNEIYKASAMLAKEKGPFPNFNKEEFLKSAFVKQALTQETIDLIAKYGLRNAFLTTCAPTGNTGIFAQCVSGGLEPVISDLYVRTVIVPHAPEGLSFPKNIVWDSSSCEEIGDWFWIKEGDEPLLKTKFNGSVYKIDRSRGLTKEEEVYDYAVLEMGDEYWKDKESYEKEGKDFYGKTIFNLDIEAHLSTMAVFAKYIDSSISKTINVPNDYPFEMFKDVYTRAYDTGYIKGVTTYRIGTMTSVVGSKDKDEDKKDDKGRPTRVNVNHAPKRPKTLPCDVHQTQIKGEKWNIFIGKLDGYPFEVFAGKATGKLPEKGSITKVKSKVYLFEAEGIEAINLLDTYGEHGSYVYSKMLSHGVPLWSIIDMCDKMLEGILGFNKAMGRVIKKYVTAEEAKFLKCSSCGSSQLVFQESCFRCQSCGASKCG